MLSLMVCEYSCKKVRKSGWLYMRLILYIIVKKWYLLSCVLIFKTELFWVGDQNYMILRRVGERERENKKKWWWWDSNPRILDPKSSALVHLATPSSWYLWFKRERFLIKLWEKESNIGLENFRINMASHDWRHIICHFYYKEAMIYLIQDIL